MSKWYRPSFSLAGKCRFGFALAVLLIIGAALFVPYRWMDKLVEQGKLEMAQVEVGHVLERHFQTGPRPAPVRQVPPLAGDAGQGGSVQTGRWQRLEGAQPGWLDGHIVIPAGAEPATAARLQPLTRWVRLTETDLASLAGEIEPSQRIQDLTHNEFVRHSINRFVENPSRWERFSFESEPRPEQAAQDEGQSTWGRLLQAWLPDEPIAGYARAVRADRSCLAAGCHGRAAATGQQDGAPASFDEGQLVGIIAVTLPAGQTNTLLLFNRIFIVTAGVLASIIAVVLFYLITARLILQPVRLLREAADRLTVSEDRGDPGEETPPASQEKRHADAASSWQQAMTITEKIRTGDEFERLARAFHEMLGRLKLAHDRLRETNRALDLQLGELTARNLALFESNKLKNEFLANVSHELRTPLNAILGFAEVVSERAGAQEDAKTRRYADNIVKAGRGLLTIINDLLDLAKIEAGRMEIRWEPTDLEQLIGALLQFARPLAEEKELMINLGVDGNVGMVETDPAKLQQVLFNLVSNAIKFTPHGGRIDVEVAAHDEEMVEIHVRDTGPGVPESQRERIFEKFRQVDQSVTREHAGTGLGLAIVKELVEMLGGNISVGGAEGQGAIFTVLLPRSRPGQPETLRSEQLRILGS